MYTIGSCTDRETTNIIEKNFTEVFLKDIINNGNVAPTARRYSEEVKKFATTLYFNSPKAYNYVRYLYTITETIIYLSYRNCNF